MTSQRQNDEIEPEDRLTIDHIKYLVKISLATQNRTMKLAVREGRDLPKVKKTIVMNTMMPKGTRTLTNPNGIIFASYYQCLVSIKESPSFLKKINTPAMHS